MAIEPSTPLNSLRNPLDNAHIDSSSQLSDRKIQRAWATILVGGRTKTGILSLLREGSNDSYALSLLDATQDETLWHQVLSAYSKFECIFEKTRQYLLTDVDLHDPVEVTFWNQQSEEELARSISNACLQLAKRADGSFRHRSRQIAKLPPSLEKVPSPSLPDPIYLHGRHVTLSPVARRLTLATKFEKELDERRQKTAPPVMVKRSTSDDDEHEKVKRWLKGTSRSTVADTPSISSAPARGKVDLCNGQFSADAVRAVSHPGSTVHCRSTSPPAPRTKTRINSDWKPRVWTAKIGNEIYKIRDVSLDLTNVRKARRDSGGFGTIRMGYVYGTKVAVKQIKPSRHHTLSDSEDKKVMGETKRFRDEAVIAMLLSVKTRHPNIIGFEGIAITEDLGACLVFPWMKNGNSLDYVRKIDVLRCPIIHGALEGLRFLHRRHFVHGDFKAYNVLISNEGKPLIADFGLATHASFEDEQQSDSLIQAGHPQWQAPELFDDENKGKRTKMSDMWAFGMFAVEILTGHLPFRDKSRTIVMMDIEKKALPPRPEHPECSNGLWQLIQRCWEYEPTIRITAKEALRIMDRISQDGGLDSSEGSVECSEYAACKL